MMKKHTHLDLVINQKFTPSAVNKNGDVRHTGICKTKNRHLKIGQRFETWLLRGTKSFKKL